MIGRSVGRRPGELSPRVAEFCVSGVCRISYARIRANDCSLRGIIEVIGVK